MHRWNCCHLQTPKMKNPTVQSLQTERTSRGAWRFWGQQKDGQPLFFQVASVWPAMQPYEDP